MPKEILIYSNIQDNSAMDFINSVNEIESDGELNIRINTNGGNPEYGWGMIAKFAEFEGKKSVKIDGKAYSMGMFFSCYADKVECLDVSNMLLHRAAYSEWFEKSEYFTEALKGNLIEINKSLETAFKNKIDVAKFEDIKGVKLKDVFSMDNRIDVFLTAKEAKQIGLVSKINKITPSKKAEIDASMMEIAAKYNETYISEDLTDKNEIEAKDALIENKQKKINMTIEKLKADHPELFAQVLAMGVEQEHDRINAFLTFSDVDMNAVKDGIKSGKQISSSQMTELTIKKVSKDTLSAMESSNADPVKTDEANASAGDVELTPLQKLEAKIDLGLNINKENK